MMNVKKIILATLVVVVFNYLAGLLNNGGAFTMVGSWKGIINMPFVPLFTGLFFVNLLFVFVYALINKSIPGKNIYLKGLLYGLLVSMLAIIPRAVSDYEYNDIFQIQDICFTLWWIVLLGLKGLIAAAIYGE